MKHTKHLSLLLLIFTSHWVYSQDVQWVKKGTSPGFENGNGIACDDSGNVYAAGQIEYDSYFDNHVVSSNGSHDIVVVKYDNAGTLKWIRSAGGPGGDVANGIAVDAAHNSYVVGELEETVDFGSGIILQAAGSNDVFLAKYSPEGNILWAKSWGTVENEKALSVAVSPSGDSYVTGYFASSITFGGTQLHSAGRREIFIVKVNTSGNIVWAKKAGGTGDDKAEGIALDKNENFYIVGSFTQSASFSGTTITNSGKNSAFVAKYNSGGSILWARAAGACCDTTQYRCVATDENDNVYVAGYFNATASFGTNNFNSTGSADIVVAKYDDAGNLQWAKHAGGIGEDIAYGIAVDKINHFVYVTGLVSAPGNFDSYAYTISGFKDIFVVAYDESGNVVWQKINGGGHRDIGSAIACDNHGSIYTTGLFNGTAFFDSFTITGFPNQPWADFYVDKISSAPAPTPVIAASNLVVTQATCTDLNLTFTPGSGMARIIVAHAGSDVNMFPINGSNYLADPYFGNGFNLGNDNFIVYNGSGNNVTVSGLLPAITYYFSVIEYNGFGATNSFATIGALTGNGLTANFTINLSGLQAICPGESLNLQASGATSYTWSPSAGLSSTIGSSVIASPHLTTVYTINALTAASCQASLFFRINVKPLPVVDFPDLTTLCKNDQPFTLDTGTPSGGVYSGPGVSNGQFDPFLAGSGTFTLTYTYTDTTGCTNENEASIHVSSLPSVTLSSVGPLCTDDSPVNLNGNPNGGIYSGSGLSSGSFDPAIGSGTYDIVYTYTGSNGCSDFTTETVIVNPSPILYIGKDTTVCAQTSILLNAGAGYASYEWSDGSTTASIVVDSSGIGIDTETFSVEVTTSLGCSVEDELEVTFAICAGVNDLTEFDQIRIFPNPFDNEFVLSSNDRISYFIYDCLGRKLEVAQNVNGQLSIGNSLAPGIYLLEVYSGKNRNVYSIVKAKKEY